VNIRKIIKEEIQKLYNEDFRYLYDRNPFIPSDEVSNSVKNALNIIEKNNLINSEGSNEGSGIQKAKSLINKEPMNHSQLKRMKAFFDNNEEEVSKEKNAGKSINNSSKIQSWELWGGTAGRQWVEKQISSTQSNNKTSKKIRNPEDGLRTKTLMDPHNTRIHKEAYINDKGELKDFNFDLEEPDNEFETLRKKWNVEDGRKVNSFGYEYWFPIEAEQDLRDLGIEWFEKERVTNKEHPDFGKVFLVFIYNPKKLS
jgi:hypothetical protein